MSFFKYYIDSYSGSEFLFKRGTIGKQQEKVSLATNGQAIKKGGGGSKGDPPWIWIPLMEGYLILDRSSIIVSSELRIRVKNLLDPDPTLGNTGSGSTLLELQPL